jgi:hypothetical protein
VSPVQEDGKRHAEHIGQLSQIPLVRLTPSSAHVPIVSLLNQHVPEVSPGHPGILISSVSVLYYLISLTLGTF